MDSSGEKTRIALSKKDPSFPLEPRFKIVKADGETVMQGSFEYGRGFSCGVAWRDPKLGVDYRVLCKYQAGPFETKIEKQVIRFQ